MMSYPAVLLLDPCCCHWTCEEENWDRTTDTASESSVDQLECQQRMGFLYSINLTGLLGSINRDINSEFKTRNSLGKYLLRFAGLLHHMMCSLHYYGSSII